MQLSTKVVLSVQKQKFQQQLDTGKRTTTFHIANAGTRLLLLHMNNNKQIYLARLFMTPSKMERMERHMRYEINKREESVIFIY